VSQNYKINLTTKPQSHKAFYHQNYFLCVFVSLWF